MAEDSQRVIQRLQAALHETQSELVEATQQLAALPWLIGAMRYLADDECSYGNPIEPDGYELECACPSCTARGALKRFYDRKPIPNAQ